MRVIYKTTNLINNKIYIRKLLKFIIQTNQLMDGNAIKFQKLTQIKIYDNNFDIRQ